MADPIFSSADKIKVLDRYRDRYVKHGHSEQALGWGEKGRQGYRYTILSQYWDMSGKVILDVGAGFGDFYEVAKELNALQYVGLELVPEFVSKGVSLYGSDPNFSLIQQDISSNIDLPVNDITMISGLFNFRLLTGENYAFIESVIRKCFEKSRVGLSANFVTDSVDFQDPLMFHADPCRIMEMALSLTRKVCLKQDYFPFEYTIHMSKDDDFEPSTSIFKDARLIDEADLKNFGF